MRTERLFGQNVGLAKVFICISSLSNFLAHHDGFIMIPCMSDLAE